MSIKSILEGDQTLLEALKAIPFIEELAEADYGNISLNKFVEIMESNGFEAEKLRNSLQQAAKLLIANNNDQPEDCFGISLNDWKLFIGEQAVEDIIAELSSLNENIDLVAGGTSTTHHGKTIGKAVGTVVLTAGVAYGIKKAVQNKNNIEKAIKVQAKVEAVTFIEKTDIPKELKTEWEKAGKKVAREANKAKETLETAARREFSDAFFEAGGKKGIIKKLMNSYEKARNQLNDKFTYSNLKIEANAAFKHYIKEGLDEFTETRYGIEFTMEEAKIRLKTTVEQEIPSLIEREFPSYEQIDGEIDNIVKKTVDDLVESSVKTLSSTLPLDSLVKDTVENYVTNNYGFHAGLAGIITNNIDKYSAPEGFNSLEHNIRVAIVEEVRKTLENDFVQRFTDSVKKDIFTDYNKGDLDGIINNAKIQNLSAQYTIFSDPEAIVAKYSDKDGVVKDAIKGINQQLDTELKGVIGAGVKKVAVQHLNDAWNNEMTKIVQKVKTEFEANIKKLLDNDAVKALAKEEVVIKGDLINEMKVVEHAAENDLEEINPTKIITNDK